MEIAFASKSFLVHEGRNDVSLHWRDADVEVIGSFSALEEYLSLRGRELLFATNGGIFEPGLRPTGLYVEEGVERVPINVDSDYGNFYLKPNGVVFLEGDRWDILSTEEYVKAERSPEIALQSGPLLLDGGVIHHAFSATSTSRFVRNAVAVGDDGYPIFVLSAEPVTLYELASFCRDFLGCDSALYLDGAISKFYSPEAGMVGDGEFASMFAVTRAR